MFTLPIFHKSNCWPEATLQSLCSGLVLSQPFLIMMGCGHCHSAGLMTEGLRHQYREVEIKKIILVSYILPASTSFVSSQIPIGKVNHYGLLHSVHYHCLYQNTFSFLVILFSSHSTEYTVLRHVELCLLNF